MSFIFGRATICARGPMGQYLPRGLTASQKLLQSQMSKLAATTPTILSKLNEQSSKSLFKIPSRNHSADSNHVTLWTAERALSAAMVPIIPLAFICPSSTMDYLLAFTITIHSHWGIEAIVVDYVRPSVFGNVIPKIALAGVYALSALTLGGLFYFVYADVGIVNAIKLLWKL